MSPLRLSGYGGQAGVSAAAGLKSGQSDRTGNIVVHRRVRSLRPLRAVGSGLYEPEAIGPMAYAPVGERRERKLYIISAISACSAVRYFLKMASDFMKFHTRFFYQEPRGNPNPDALKLMDGGSGFPSGA